MPTNHDALNFDLLITRAGDGYRAYVISATGGDAESSFALPFSPHEIGRLVGGNGIRRSARPEQGTHVPAPNLRELGGRLYNAIFQEAMHSVLVASQAEAEREGNTLRIRLRFSEEATELATLPWEILFDPQQQHFLALSEHRPILRYLSLPRSRPALVVKPPLSVLTVLASPGDHVPLDVAQEWAVMASALEPLTAGGKVVLERLETPSFDALRRRLLGEPVHVLHFVGHGLFDPDGRQGMLLFEDNRGQGHAVPASSLAMLLHNHSSLRLVYLNACEGAIADEGNVFAGVAQTLVQGGVPAAVAMQAEITDTAAIELTRTFYTALATGRPVDAALTQARVALAANGSDEWAIPVLFSRSPDNRLFDVVEVLPTPDCPYPGMRPFTEAQADRFFGRDKEIEDGVARLRQHPFLTVIGPSGSGKSSLIYAGLLPALKRSRHFGDGDLTVKTMRPGETPFTTLAHLLELSAQSPVPNPQSPTLLFIDQFEETFTLADEAEATQFLAALHDLIGTLNLHILLTVRADFYPELMTMGPLWDKVKANRLELTPLGDDDLWDAIVQPAAAVGVTVDEALAVALIKDAAEEAGVLPLVQETLVLLWEKVARRRLGLAAYTEMAEGGRSGIAVAIDRRAGVVYNNLPASAQPIARRIFLRLVQFGAGRADTRRQQTVAELRASGDAPVIFDETLRTLTDSRLLTTSGSLDEDGSGERRVDISHEALIGGWGLLQTWIWEKREAESARRRLEDKVAEWERLDHSGGLLDEYELREAENWLDQAEAEELGVSDELLDLIDASRQTIEERKAAEAAARQRELDNQKKLADAERKRAESEKKRAEENQQSANRLKQRAILLAALAFAAALLAVVAAVFGISSFNSERLAEEKEAIAVAEAERANQAEREATSRLFLARGERFFPDDPLLGMRLALEGLALITDTRSTTYQELKTDMLSMLKSGRVQNLAETFANSEKNWIDPNGRYAVVQSPGQNATLWSLYDGIQIANLGDHVASATWSPSGNEIVVENTQYPSQKHLWRIRRDNVQGRALGEAEITFSPEGHYYLARSGSSTALWNVAQDQEIADLPINSSASFVTDEVLIIRNQHDDIPDEVWQLSAEHILKSSAQGKVLTTSSGDGAIQTASGPTVGVLFVASRQDSNLLWRLHDNQFYSTTLRNIPVQRWIIPRNGETILLDYANFIDVVDLSKSELVASLPIHNANTTHLLENMLVDVGQSTHGGTFIAQTSLDDPDSIEVQKTDRIETVGRAFVKSSHLLIDYATQGSGELWRIENGDILTQSLAGSIDQWYSLENIAVIAYTGESPRDELWRLVEGEIVTHELPASVLDVTPLPDAHSMVIVYGDGTPAQLWHASFPDPIVAPLQSSSFDIYADGPVLAVNYAEGDDELWWIRESVILTTSLGNPLSKWEGAGVIQYSPYADIAFTSIQDYYDGSTNTIWSVEGRPEEPREKIAGRTLNMVEGLRSSPSSEALVIDYSGIPGEVWLTDNRRIHLPAPVINVDFAPTGNMFVVRYGENTGEIWNIRNGNVITASIFLRPFDDNLTFADDGTLLLVEGVNRAEVWRPHNEGFSHIALDEKINASDLSGVRKFLASDDTLFWLDGTEVYSESVRHEISSLLATEEGSLLVIFYSSSHSTADSPRPELWHFNNGDIVKRSLPALNPMHVSRAASASAIVAHPASLNEGAIVWWVEHGSIKEHRGQLTVLGSSITSNSVQPSNMLWVHDEDQPELWQLKRGGVFTVSLRSSVRGIHLLASEDHLLVEYEGSAPAEIWHIDGNRVTTTTLGSHEATAFTNAAGFRRLITTGDHTTFRLLWSQSGNVISTTLDNAVSIDDYNPSMHSAFFKPDTDTFVVHRDNLSSVLWQLRNNVPISIPLSGKVRDLNSGRTGQVRTFQSGNGFLVEYVDSTPSELWRLTDTGAVSETLPVPIFDVTVGPDDVVWYNHGPYVERRDSDGKVRQEFLRAGDGARILLIDNLLVNSRHDGLASVSVDGIGFQPLLLSPVQNLQSPFIAANAFVVQPSDPDEPGWLGRVEDARLTLNELAGPIRWTASNTSGSHFAVGYPSGKADLWKLREGQLISVSLGNGVDGVSFAPDGKTLHLVGPSRSELWRLTKIIPVTVSVPLSPTDVTFSADGQFILLHYGNRIDIHRLADFSLAAVAFDNTHASRDGVSANEESDAELFLVENTLLASDGTSISWLPIDDQWSGETYQDAQFHHSSNGEVVTLGDQSNAILVRNRSSSTEVWQVNEKGITMSGPISSTKKLSIALKGNHSFIEGSTLWTIRDGDIISHPLVGSVESTNFSPNDTFLMIHFGEGFLGDKNVRQVLYSLQTGWTLEFSQVREEIFTSDQRMIIFYENGQVDLIDLNLLNLIFSDLSASTTADVEQWLCNVLAEMQLMDLYEDLFLENLSGREPQTCANSSWLDYRTSGTPSPIPASSGSLPHPGNVSPVVTPYSPVATPVVESQ